MAIDFLRFLLIIIYTFGATLGAFFIYIIGVTLLDVFAVLACLVVSTALIHRGNKILVRCAYGILIAFSVLSLKMLVSTLLVQEPIGVTPQLMSALLAIALSFITFKVINNERKSV